MGYGIIQRDGTILSTDVAKGHVAERGSDVTLCGRGGVYGIVVTPRPGTNYAALVGCGKCYAAIKVRMEMEALGPRRRRMY